MKQAYAVTPIKQEHFMYTDCTYMFGWLASILFGGQSEV